MHFFVCEYPRRETPISVNVCRGHALSNSLARLPIPERCAAVTAAFVFIWSNAQRKAHFLQSLPASRIEADSAYYSPEQSAMVSVTNDLAGQKPDAAAEQREASD